MHYEVEANTARPSKPPIWKPVLDPDSDEAAKWGDATGPNGEVAYRGARCARVVQVADDGARMVLETSIPAAR